MRRPSVYYVTSEHRGESVTKYPPTYAIVKKEIKSNHDFDIQYEKFLELYKFSWHKHTGQKIRELAKMMEVKYNVKIIDE